MIEEQKETFELISIIMSDIYKNMSPKEIENFFNATILDMIDKKDLAMQESTIKDEPDPLRVNLHDLDDIYKKFINIGRTDTAPDIQTYAVKTNNIQFGNIQPGEYRLQDNHNWHQAQKIHIDQALDYTERVMDQVIVDGPTYTIHDPYGEDATIRNLALEEKKKIKNPNPNFEHLLNKKKKRKNKGIK